MFGVPLFPAFLLDGCRGRPFRRGHALNASVLLSSKVQLTVHITIVVKLLFTNVFPSWPRFLVKRNGKNVALSAVVFVSVVVCVVVIEKIAFKPE